MLGSIKRRIHRVCTFSTSSSSSVALVGASGIEVISCLAFLGASGVWLIYQMTVFYANTGTAGAGESTASNAFTVAPSAPATAAIVTASVCSSAGCGSKP
jgi:hypothetical protein